jgi:hypothetical protein|tara:strand:- start:557 stop:763 length:207 start_codon:yes stop_codon:yes gene_type:complete
MNSWIETAIMILVTGGAVCGGLKIWRILKDIEKILSDIHEKLFLEYRLMARDKRDEEIFSRTWGEGEN